MSSSLRSPPTIPPKPPSAQISSFYAMCEAFGLKKVNRPELALDIRQAIGVMEAAARLDALETIGFLMAGLYYVLNPRSLTLVTAIKEVFLIAASQSISDTSGTYALNI